MFFKNYFVVDVFENGYREYNGLVRKFELLFKITYGNVNIYIKIHKQSKSCGCKVKIRDNVFIVSEGKKFRGRGPTH